MARRLYNFNGYAGCVQIRMTRETGTKVGIYNNEQANLDDAGGPWSLICEDHGYVLAVPSLDVARQLAPHPLEWCEFCNGNAHVEEVPGSV